MNSQSVIKQIDEALARLDDAQKRRKYDDFSDLPQHERSDLVTSLVATIERIAPNGSTYLDSARTIIQKLGPANGHSLDSLGGILMALKRDISSGYMQSIQELIHADIFSDFLEMADYLLAEGFKDPAAVLAGGVLEEHLRKLCIKVNISISSGAKSKKADLMNSDLAASGSITKLDQKSVTAWLDLRNKAAHGRYAEYSKEQVSLMVMGIRDFLIRTPA